MKYINKQTNAANNHVNYTYFMIFLTEWLTNNIILKDKFQNPNT